MADLSDLMSANRAALQQSHSIIIFFQRRTEPTFPGLKENDGAPESC